jgi:hypothetical protein
MKQIPRAVWLFLAIGLACVLLALLWPWNRDAAANAALKMGAVEVEARPIYRAWFDSTAQCLGVSKTLPSDVRYFVGDTVPPLWTDHKGAAGDYLGYAYPADRLILVARGHAQDRALIVHEQGHLVYGGGHTAKWFTSGCGVAGATVLPFGGGILPSIHGEPGRGSEK